QFIEGLMASDPCGKVHVFYLIRKHRNPVAGELATEGGGSGFGKSSSGTPAYPNEIYVHSKVWIIDDICAKIGTTNVDRRSFSHDSEMDLVMVDGAVEEGARALALRLRLALWGEHLNLPRAKRECLKDYKLALSFWLSPPAGARICPYNVDT